MKKLILSAGFIIALTGYVQGQTTATQVSSSENAAKSDAVTTAVLPIENKNVKGRKAKRNARAAAAAEVPQDVKISIPAPVINYKDVVPASAKKD